MTADYIVSATNETGAILVLRADDERSAIEVANLFRQNDYTRVTISIAGSDPD
ncbi:hypothetical protein ACM61V_07770 [Sphingomonas sp. TX0543]